MNLRIYRKGLYLTPFHAMNIVEAVTQPLRYLKPSLISQHNLSFLFNGTAYDLRNSETRSHNSNKNPQIKVPLPPAMMVPPKPIRYQNVPIHTGNYEYCGHGENFVEHCFEYFASQPCYRIDRTEAYNNISGLSFKFSPYIEGSKRPWATC